MQETSKINNEIETNRTVRCNFDNCNACQCQKLANLDASRAAANRQRTSRPPTQNHETPSMVSSVATGKQCSMGVVHDNTLRCNILVRTPRRPEDRRDRVTVLQTLETTPSSRNSLCLWHKQSEREFFRNRFNGGSGSGFMGFGWTLVASAILTSNNKDCCAAACVNSASDNSATVQRFTCVGSKVADHAGGWVRDLTCECVESNPGPGVLDTLSRSTFFGRTLLRTGIAGGCLQQKLVTSGRQLSAPIRQFRLWKVRGNGLRMDALTPVSRQPHALLHHRDSWLTFSRPFATNIDQFEESKEFWRRLIEKKTMDDDAVGAAEAEMKYHDADMQLHEAKAAIARANGDEEGAKKAEMAKAKAEMAKAKAEMTKAKAEMTKADAKMTKAKAAGDIQGEELAGKDYFRAEAEYEAAKKIHNALLEQVVGKNVLDATHLRPSTYKFPHTLVERQYQLKQILAAAALNWASRNEDARKSHAFVIVPGASGLGKSRVGFESGKFGDHFDDIRQVCQDLQEHVPRDRTEKAAEQQEVNSGMIAKLVENDVTVSEFATVATSSFYLLIDFNNGRRFDDFDKSFPASNRLGFRLAKSAFPTQQSQLINPTDFPATTVLNTILKSLLSDRQQILLILHLDEFQMYMEAASKAKISDPISHFKGMLGELSDFMRGQSVDASIRGRFAILPILTGTSAQGISYSLTEHPTQWVHPKPLSHEAATELVLRHYQSRGVSEHEMGPIMESTSFKVALADTGYIPRFIAEMIDRVKVPCVGSEWGSMLRGWLGSYLSDGKIDLFDRVGLKETLLFAVFLRLPINRRDALPGGVLYEDLARHGIIEVEESDQISMPYVLCEWLNRHLNDPVFPHDLMGIVPSSTRQWHWQDFERLCPFLHRARCNGLLTMRQMRIAQIQDLIDEISLTLSTAGRMTEETMRLRGSLREASTRHKELVQLGNTFALSEIFPGARGAAPLLDRRFHIKPLHYVKEASKILTTTKHKHVDPGASVHGGDVTHDILDCIAECAENTALVDARSACVEVSSQKMVHFMIQCKHSGLDDLGKLKGQQVSAASLEGWYNLCQSNLANNCIFIFLANRTVDVDDELLQRCPNLLVISRTELVAFLGPFAHRGLMASYDTDD